MSTVVVTPLKIFDATAYAAPGEDHTFARNVQSQVAAINTRISEMREERKSTLAYLGMGLLGLLLTIRNPFLPAPNPTWRSLSTIRNIAFIIFGFGFFLKNIVWLKEQRKEIDARVQAYMKKSGSQFIVRRDDSVEDETYTEEQKERMGKYNDITYHKFRYHFAQDDVITVTPPVFSFFSIKEMQIDSQANSNNLEDVKKKFKPWRDLLCEMTKPEHIGKFSPAELGIVGYRTYSGNGLVKEMPLENVVRSYLYKYDSQKNGEITAWHTLTGTKLVIKTVEEFREFLKKYFSFDPVSTELVN
jgi:hypothetical protein